MVTYSKQHCSPIVLLLYLIFKPLNDIELSPHNFVDTDGLYSLQLLTTFLASKSK